LKYSLEALLNEKILVLDGAMGTAIQKLHLDEKAFSGGCNCHQNLKGNSDILNITHPELIKKIHQSYLQAGADIIETNTLNGNSISQADYALEHQVYNINYHGAKIAREAADEYTHQNPTKPRFVAGSIGPTNKTASLSPDVENPGLRNISFDELREAYEEQIAGLVDGGVDILCRETRGEERKEREERREADQGRKRKEVNLPIMISGNSTEKSGRRGTGQTLAAWDES